MGNLLKYLNRRKEAPMTPAASLVDSTSINFETDSLRFLFEAYLIEYDTIRREIELRIELQEHTTNYLLILVGVLISAIQLFGDQAGMFINVLNSQPFLYLIFGSIALFFPIRDLAHNLFIRTLGRYARYILIPKLNAISGELSKQSKAQVEFKQWEIRNYPPWLQGTMKWEDYRGYAHHQRSILIFGMIGLFRYIFVSIPSILFVLAFLSIKSGGEFWQSWTTIERISSVTFVIIIVIMLFGFIHANKDTIGLSDFRKPSSQ